MRTAYPPDLESAIQNLIATGRYTDPDAVVREAVRLLEASVRQHEALQTMVHVGIDEADRGEVDEWTPELMARLQRDAHDMYLRGDAPDPDVLP